MSKPRNPYSDLADHQLWRRAMSRIAGHQVDPSAGEAKFKIAPNDKVGTAGSCFAQHIAKRLSHKGYNYYVTETGPDLNDQDRADRGYGVYSARYGNIYTPKQLSQLFSEALGQFKPADRVWQRADGQYVDALRPLVEPNGFASFADVENEREQHLRCIEELMKNVDIFVFTLGLTEAWRSKADGTVYPVAPGVSAGHFNEKLYEFVNFTVSDVISDLLSALELLKSVNPNVKCLLTVSPVPLIATYEKRHVLVSTTYSKSVLRVAAEEAVKQYNWVDYFPSYEVITGNHGGKQYFDSDLREVNSRGVSHAMRAFSRKYTNSMTDASTSSVEPYMQENEEVVCDEEVIDKMSRSS